MAKSSKHKSSEFRAVDHIETSLHDPVKDRWEPGCADGGVRLYCTQAGSRWHLQVRAQVKTRTGTRGKKFAVGTASMSREDLAWLRQLIDEKLSEDQ